MPLITKNILKKVAGQAYDVALITLLTKILTKSSNIESMLSQFSKEHKETIQQWRDTIQAAKGKEVKGTNQELQKLMQKLDNLEQASK